MPKKSENSEKELERKNISSWSSGLSILCLILRIFEYIGIVGLIIAMLCIPVISKGIKFEENKITFFKKVIEYKVNEVDIVTFKVDGKEYTLNTKDIMKISSEGFDVKGIKNVCIAGSIFLIASLVVSIIALKKIGDLLKRMSKEDKVFVKDGHQTFKTLMILYIVDIGIGFVGGLTTSILLKTNANVSINFSFVIAALVLYFVSMVYKYGETLEEK